MLNRVIALAVISLVAGLFMAGAAQASFSDVPRDHWAYDAVDYLEQEGLAEGYPDGTFRGDQELTRYEFAIVIARMYDAFLDMLDDVDAPGPGIEIEAILDMLMEEFQPELDELYDLVAENADRIDALEGTVDTFDGRITEIGGLVDGMNSRFHPFADLLIRAEGIFPDTGFENKRGLYRFRFGFTSQITDELVFGARLASGRMGGVQNTNVAIEDTFGYDSLTIDQAYMRFQPMSWPGFTMWGGKFAPPWKTTPMVWDGDAMVEGLAQHYTDGNFHFYLGEMVPTKEGLYILAQIGYDDLFIEGFDVRATYHFIMEDCWKDLMPITTVYNSAIGETNPYRAWELYAIYSNSDGNLPWAIEANYLQRDFEAIPNTAPYNLAAWARLTLGGSPAEVGDWRFRTEWGRVHGNAVMDWLAEAARGAGDSTWWGANITYRLMRNTDMVITFLTVDRISVDDMGYDRVMVDIVTWFK